MTTTLVHLKHGYDQASNRLYRRDEVARTNSGSFDELYAYDGLHRLTSFDRGQLNSGNTALSSGPTLNQSWSLDATGNWKGFTQTVQNALTQTRTHNEVNEIDGISKTVGADWPTPAYDDNGNTTSFPQPGSLEDSYTAVYDPWNRLVKLTNDADDDKTVAEYEYDGLNRRTQKKVYDDGSLDYTRHYYHSDQWQVLEERIDSDTSADRQYVWGQRYVDDLILRDHDSTRLYALTDALFNVVAITDDTGDVKERFAYQPYGESEELDPDFATPYSGTDYEWEYRFTGRELDLESGLQLNRMRYLHLQLGRWLTWDPIGYEAEFNVYNYVLNDPLQMLDPLGLEPVRRPWPWVDNGRVNLNREQFDSCVTQWCGHPLPAGQIDRGCIGLCSALIGNVLPNDQCPGDPRFAPNTEGCFAGKEGEQEAVKACAYKVCPPGQFPFIFAMQGEQWNLTPLPKPGQNVPPGSIPIGDKPGGSKYLFNYICRFPSKDRVRYCWMNHMVIPNDPQRVTFDDKPTVDSHYPVEMWCCTCASKTLPK